MQQVAPMAAAGSDARGGGRAVNTIHSQLLQMLHESESQRKELLDAFETAARTAQQLQVPGLITSTVGTSLDGQGTHSNRLTTVCL